MRRAASIAGPITTSAKPGAHYNQVRCPPDFQRLFCGTLSFVGPIFRARLSLDIFCAIEGDRFAKLDVFKLVGSPTLIYLNFVDGRF